MKSSIYLVFFSTCMLASLSESLPAQVVQLPTLRIFNVRTSVSVPDRGTVVLGGVDRSATSNIRRGVPGLRGPLFSNHGAGGSQGSNQAFASAEVIVMSELEAEVLAEARRRREKAARNDPNGPPVIQQQADFISRNIGRSRKR